LVIIEKQATPRFLISGFVESREVDRINTWFQHSQRTLKKYIETNVCWLLLLQCPSYIHCQSLYKVCRLTRWVPLVDQELLTLLEDLGSSPVFNVVRVTRPLVLCVCFVDPCLSFCTFSFGHCFVCSSSIYRFWLPLWYLLATVLSVLLRYMDSDCPFGIFWPLCCLFFYDIRILIASLVSFGHCVVCSSSIYGFWLPLWYLQTFLINNPHDITYKNTV
jgi:hypothetical protein